MKKFLVFVIIAAVLGFNTIAYAAETDGSSSVEAGITPDSILYSADKLVEDIQLLLTFDSQKDAELLLQFASERLSEAEVMTQEQKSEFVEAAVKDYTELMNEAEDKITEVAADESTTSEVKEELTQKLEDTAQVDEDIQNELGDEQQEQLEEKTTEIAYTANVVKNLDAAVVQSLRETGMGFGQIAHTIALSELSGKTVDEITALLESGKGIGEIAKEFGIQPSKINVKKSDTVSENDTTETATTEDTTAVPESTAIDQSTSDTAVVQITATQNTAVKESKKVEKKSETINATQEITTNANTTISDKGNNGKGITADNVKTEKSSKGKK